MCYDSPGYFKGTATISESMGLYDPYSLVVGWLTLKARPKANVIRDIEYKIIGRLEPRKPGADRIATGKVYWAAIDCIDSGWDVHSKDIFEINTLQN